MKVNENEWPLIEELLAELTVMQQQRLLACARNLISGLTEDDLLQPNDFPLLEQHPIFRYEEGVLAGIQTAQVALRAFRADLRENNDKRTTTT